MSELIIQEHKQKFLEAKEGLKRFSEREERDFWLPSVAEDGGLFDLFSHSVTGEELNERLGRVQDILIDMNQDIIENGKEFRQVYDALEALDSEYIPAILLAIQSAEKANTDVRIAQDDIRNILDYQKKTLEILQEFKNRVESYEHLPDIDLLWGKTILVQQELAEVKAELQQMRSRVGTEQTSSTPPSRFALIGYCVGTVAVVELVLFFLKGL